MVLFLIKKSKDNCIDPVGVPGNFGENIRVGSYAAGPGEPGHNSHLLAVDKQGAAVVTLCIMKF
jgi:hypothetical protein